MMLGRSLVRWRILVLRRRAGVLRRRMRSRTWRSRLMALGRRGRMLLRTALVGPAFIPVVEVAGLILVAPRIPRVVLRRGSERTEPLIRSRIVFIRAVPVRSVAWTRAAVVGRRRVRTRLSR